MLRVTTSFCSHPCCEKTYCGNKAIDKQKMQEICTFKRTTQWVTVMVSLYSYMFGASLRGRPFDNWGGGGDGGGG